MANALDIRIQIAPFNMAADLWEVRVIGPGGWRTSISQASLSACRSDAAAWSQVLQADVEEYPHDH